MRIDDLEYLKRNLLNNQKVVLYRQNEWGKFYIEINVQAIAHAVTNFIYHGVEELYIDLSSVATANLSLWERDFNVIIEHEGRFYTFGLEIRVEQVFGGIEDSFLGFQPIELNHILKNISSFSAFSSYNLLL